MPKKKQPVKLCYVIMPFSKTKACTEEEWTEIFEAVIKSAVEGAGLGYRCLRSEATTGNIIKKVVNSLYQANVVIADLTDRNPNVFYELGVRHTLANRSIIIAQRRKDIPSDLDGYASHVYRWKTTAQRTALGKKLRDLLHHIEDDLDRSDNPVSDFLHERSIGILHFQHGEKSLKLRALVQELDLVATLLHGTLEDSDTKAHARIYGLTSAHSYPALDHLIATQYVYNRKFGRSASAIRAILDIIGGHKVDRETVQAALARVESTKRNAERILAAYEAGDTLEAVEIEWPADSRLLP